MRTSGEPSTDEDSHLQPASTDSNVSPGSISTASDTDVCDNMIARLCSGRRQLNSDRAGRLRFFGPTSSLHLTESIVSSVLIRESRGSKHNLRWQDDFSAEVQDYLFNLYWTYQHPVMPCIHKDAFLQDMANGDTRYCSKLLVYCILTRAASICDQPWLRTLALSDDADDDPPYLVGRCSALLDVELNNPSLTTTQALQLLSEMYCAISHDTKGWMYAGGAGRLAYELGLHSDTACFDANLTDLDKEVRQIVFWSTFNLDRAWSLYHGRPHSIKLEDVSVQKLDSTSQTTSWDGRLSAAWSGLLEIVGEICDMLNGPQATNGRTGDLSERLTTWSANLGLELSYYATQSPAVILLHMQHASAQILLHRPQAQFGRASIDVNPERDASRRICVENACTIADYLKDYSGCYGSVSTMSWVALHIIATAATTLIAAAVEGREMSDPVQLLTCLKMCLGSLGELEKSHVVTRRVKKVIQHAMRLLHLDEQLASDWSMTSMPWIGTSQQLTPFIEDPSLKPTVNLLNCLPTGGQFDMLHSFNAYFT